MVVTLEDGKIVLLPPDKAEAARKAAK